MNNESLRQEIAVRIGANMGYGSLGKEGMLDDIMNDIAKHDQQLVESILETLQGVNDDKWHDSVHCTCLPFASDLVKAKYLSKKEES